MPVTGGASALPRLVPVLPTPQLPSPLCSPTSRPARQPLHHKAITTMLGPELSNPQVARLGPHTSVVSGPDTLLLTLSLPPPWSEGLARPPSSEGSPCLLWSPWWERPHSPAPSGPADAAVLGAGGCVSGSRPAFLRGTWQSLEHPLPKPQLSAEASQPASVGWELPPHHWEEASRKPTSQER